MGWYVVGQVSNARSAIPERCYRSLGVGRLTSLPNVRRSGRPFLGLIAGADQLPDVSVSAFVHMLVLCSWDVHVLVSLVPTWCGVHYIFSYISPFSSVVRFDSSQVGAMSFTCVPTCPSIRPCMGLIHSNLVLCAVRTVWSVALVSSVQYNEM